MSDEKGNHLITISYNRDVHSPSQWADPAAHHDAVNNHTTLHTTLPVIYSHRSLSVTARDRVLSCIPRSSRHSSLPPMSLPIPPVTVDSRDTGSLYRLTIPADTLDAVGLAARVVPARDASLGRARVCCVLV